MDDTDLLQKLEAELSALLERHPPLPVTVDLWRILAGHAERRLQAAERRLQVHDHQALARALGGASGAPGRA